MKRNLKSLAKIYLNTLYVQMTILRNPAYANMGLDRPSQASVKTSLQALQAPTLSRRASSTVVSGWVPQRIKCLNKGACIPRSCCTSFQYNLSLFPVFFPCFSNACINKNLLRKKNFTNIITKFSFFEIFLAFIF